SARPDIASRPAPRSTRIGFLLFMTTTSFRETVQGSPRRERMAVMLAMLSGRQNPALDAGASSLGSGFRHRLWQQVERHLGSKAKSPGVWEVFPAFAGVFPYRPGAALPIIDSPGRRSCQTPRLRIAPMA